MGSYNVHLQLNDMNKIDRVICEIDVGLRTLFADPHARRPPPGQPNMFSEAGGSFDAEFPDAARDESMRLMRVNHAGEVCAQALYQGQAMVARSPETRNILEQAAREERDHLAWCHTRITELNGKASRLTPIFYASSFVLGAISGLLGDKWSMGFLVETERQVEAHLSDHLNRLPEIDLRSRQIIEAMRIDEIHHAQIGLEHGATELPPPIKAAMRGVSKAMTATTYWF